MNEKNLDFYNNLGVDPFKELAVIGGFNSYIDLDILYPRIANAKSILEIGAGYGRCLDYFLKKDFNARLLAVEQSPVLIAYLNEKYCAGQVAIYPSDIKTLVLNEKVDAALWMWSGIIDFSREEQASTLKRINGMLQNGGKLFIDVPKIGFTTYAVHKDAKNLHLDSKYGTLDCFIPDKDDMEYYKQNGGFQKLDVLDYDTTTNKKRTLYIMEK